MESQIKKIHQQLVSKEITCTALVQEKLGLLQQNKYNSVNSLLDTWALDLAAKVDAKIANGETIGLLEGIPFGIKDVFMLQGTLATASSEMLKNYKSPYTATAIQKLLDAGAIPLVKENCDFLVKIPMKGKITSLNASVSAGIIMYEVVKNRN